MLEYPRYLGEGIMSKKRKTYSAEFKTKVVLELLSGEYTTAQVVSKYERSQPTACKAGRNSFWRMLLWLSMLEAPPKHIKTR